MHTKDSPAAALWNPTAIALWSVPFSPLFGAWLHMHNWTALGDARQADVARRWFNALLILMVFNVLVEAIGERVNSSAGMASWISLAAFVAWYALAARPHAKAVRAPRRCAGRQRLPAPQVGCRPAHGRAGRAGLLWLRAPGQRAVLMADLKPACRSRPRSPPRSRPA